MAKEDQVKFEVSATDTATKVFRQVGAGAQALQKNYDDLKHTFEAVAAGVGIKKIIDEAAEWERASNRLTAVLRATGNSAGLTRMQLDEMGHSLSKSTPFNAIDIGNAQANLLKFGNIHGSVFREALKLSADYAAFTGGNVTEATQAIGRALADPVNGLKALQREFGNLTFTQKEYIAQLEAQGRTEEAQIAILDIVRNKIGGVAAGANTGLTGLLALASKAWDQVGEAAALAFAKMERGPSLMGSLAESPGASPAAKPAPALSWEEQFARQTNLQTQPDIKAAEAADRLREAHQKAIPVLSTWMKLLGDQTNEQRALAFVLEGEGKLWTDLDKAKLLNLAVELDYRRVYKDRMELSALYAKALRDETLGEEENLATRVKVIETDWMRGTKETFRDYIDHATNAAEQSAMLFGNAFKNMEDGLVEFVRTGKLDFRSFADSVVADLIRIQVRQALAGFANVSGLAAFFGGLGGGGGDPYPGLQSHRGGIVGVDSQPRMVNPAWFHGAPRMHMGGLAGDEVPVILQRGERVIPRGGSAGVIFNQVFNIGSDVTNAQLARVAQAGRDSAMAGFAEERKRNPNGPFGG